MGTNQERVVLSPHWPWVPNDNHTPAAASTNASADEATPAAAYHTTATPTDNDALSVRLQRGLQGYRRVPVGEGLVWCQEALLLQDGPKGMPLRATTTLRHPAFRTAAHARHLPVRLQRGLSQLLHVLAKAMVAKQIGILLQEPEQGLQVEHEVGG
jgi:hypothetical protein